MGKGLELGAGFRHQDVYYSIISHLTSHIS